MNLKGLKIDNSKDVSISKKKVKLINLNPHQHHLNKGSENFYTEDAFFRIYGYYPDEHLGSRHPFY